MPQNAQLFIFRPSLITMAPAVSLFSKFYQLKGEKKHTSLFFQTFNFTK